MSNKSSLRIHPAIGMARVGNSKEYFLGPESLAGIREEGTEIHGGLPIKKGTESTPITSSDIRDESGQLKKQAARFKIYQYQEDSYSYPSKASSEVVVGSVVDGKTVAKIVWTVHLANKKANCWGIDDDYGMYIYEDDMQDPPKLRNPDVRPSPDAPADPASQYRLRRLVIDAGPRAIGGVSAPAVHFCKETTPTYADDSGVIHDAVYPVNYPALPTPSGASPAADDPCNQAAYHQNSPSQPIVYLGELETDEKGRLIVIGGDGLACSFNDDGTYKSVPKEDPNNEYLSDDVDNNNWLDDTSDGPVNAVLIFEDGTTRALESTAWVVCTDPSYAPQTANVVSLWDEIYNSWIRHPQINLMPDIYSDGKYNDSFKPYFKDEVHTIYNAAYNQMWNTSLNDAAFHGHKKMAEFTEQRPPTGFNILDYVREPIADFKPKENPVPPNYPLDPAKIRQMPLALGDAGKAFLSVTFTQYFFIKQWQNGGCENAQQIPLTPGEFLDKAILFNCLGGRFSPGIDMTFIIRDINLYNYKNYKDPNVGAFRVNAKKYDYSQSFGDDMGVGVGYVPLHTAAVEPGDICKFMAIPWHTDYNSCATHIPYPNPNSAGKSLTNAEAFDNSSDPRPNIELFWSWPAQRPVSVYTFADLQNNGGQFFQTPRKVIPAMEQRFSVRGEGTNADDVKSKDDDDNTTYDNSTMQVGRYQQKVGMVENWHQIGMVIQSAAIDDYPYEDRDIYLEVESNFDHDASNAVGQFPTKATEIADPPMPDPPKPSA